MTVEQVNKIADQLTGVQFQILIDSEILKLSVAEIKSPRAFDETGAIIEGGLYDLRLGATKNEKCHTCMLGYFGCAGHFGHISLPLPIYNPFLIRLAYQLMELCCNGCHRLVLRPLEGELLLLQLDLLDLDMEHCCSEVKEFSDEFLFSSDSKDMTEEEIVEKFRKKLSESNILKILNERRKNPQNFGQNTLRSVVEKKHQLVKDFLRRRPMSFLKECLFCKKKRTNYSILNNATIVESVKEMSENEPGKPDPLLGKKILENMEKGKRVMHPISVRSMFRKLWLNEKQILSTILPFLSEDNLINIPQDPILDALVDPKKLGDQCPLDVFFNQQMLVTPSKFRPLRVMQGRQFEDSKSSKFSAVISSAGSLSKVYQNLLDSDKDQIEVVTNSKRSARKSSTKRVSELATREAATDLFYRFWTELQINCNLLYDAELTVKKTKINAVQQPGLKQLIEKKEGLFRKNMMGKRVNYAARSVISPDPYIMVDEIGFPEIFAKRLSFPEPVNDHNYEMLRDLVQNGPDIYPGAMSVVLENGTLVRLNPKDVNQRKAMAQQVAVQVTGRMNPDMKVKVVNRHLRSGDVLLINRQPTLHKPSIMAHRARVLPGERTIRLHYANCKCYNADFDGDEMNAHFPQSYLTRAEGYNIVSVNYQYLVPKDGTPLSGLIQDHIVAATLLTYRGQFLSKVDYQNLVYAAVSFLNRPIKFLSPTILKPEKLWSGKQVASTIILNLIPDGKQAPTLKIASKLKPSIFISQDARPFTAGGLIEANDLCESQVIIREGELLVGAFDKSNLGNTSYGIVHTCYELYGGQVSSALLTAFARLANAYLQSICGFTLGIYDILLTAEADKYRKKMIHKSTKVGDEAVANAFNVPNVKDKEAIFNEFQEAHTSANPIYMKILDASVKSKTDEFNNNIAKKCLPGGLLKPFPYNHLQMMIQPGAKGGLVNALQISCLLGQIELEGKRVPLMISGKTLPSFKPYETSPKAGGFVTGRFLTGIRPQEFFFHCMAGREGLIDTAVKTSRSGYLQRCLIKHLEGLVVNYDNTVRDSDHTVIQFLYGEDGLDILKSQLLKPKAIPLLAQNFSTLRLSKEDIKRLNLTTEKDIISDQSEIISNWELVNGTDRLSRKRGTAFPKFFDRHWSKHGGKNADKEVKELLMKNIYNSWNALSKDERCELNHYCMACPDPVCFRVNPGRNFGVISEKMEKLIQDYVSFNPDNLLSYKKKSEEKVESRGLINVKDFKKVFYSHYMKSLVEPGEAVGLLAAQSIGEPSTQMTLNTFHFAGRGEMNVTLGIPRLREILMTASPNISTPSMDIPIRRDLDPESVEHLADQVRIQLTSTTLANVLEHVDIVEKFEITPSRCSHLIILKFKFLRRRYFKQKYPVSSAAILEFFEQKFLKQFGRSLKRKIEIQKKMGNSLVTSALGRNRSDNKTGEEDENDLAFDSEKSLLNKIGEDDDDDSDDENGDGDADDMRNRGTRDQELTYEEPEDEEKERSDSEDDDEINESILIEKDQEEIIQQNEEEVMDLESINWGRRDNVDAVLKSFCKHFFEYKYDQKKEQWCELTLDFDIGEFKLDLASLIQEEVSKAVMHKIGKIDKAFLVKNSQAKNGEYEKMIKTEGVSFLSLIKYSNILDLNRIYSNDIHAIANTYGIEAGRRAIISEMVNVFGMYGIEIDSRHLYLIADYMTSTGVIKGMNRQSMLTNASPIQQITFETSMNFIKMAAMLNTKDELNSPSSRIFVGRPVTAGSGISQCVMGKLKNKSVSDKKEEGKRKFLDIKTPAKRAKLE